MNALNKFNSEGESAQGSGTTSTDCKYPTRAAGPGNTPNKTGDDDNNDNAGLSGGAITGIVLGAIALVIITLVINLKCHNRKFVP